jgi:hypothetical protein
MFMQRLNENFIAYRYGLCRLLLLPGASAER